MWQRRAMWECHPSVLQVRDDITVVAVRFFQHTRERSESLVATEASPLADEGTWLCS